MDLDSALTGKSAEGASATRILRDDHEEIRRLAEKYRAAGDDAVHARRALAQAIALQAELHARIEAVVFYPAAERVDAALVEHAREEHRRIAERVQALEAIDAGDEVAAAQYFETAQALIDELARHMAEEEASLFPRIERTLAADLVALGCELVRRKEALTRSAADFEGPAT